jgi:hypothetical protein
MVQHQIVADVIVGILLGGQPWVWHVPETSHTTQSNFKSAV